MSDEQLRRRLSPMDAFFLYIEREEQPMHVGATTIFEGKIPFRKFVKNLESRLHLLPRYRQRVVAAPLNLGHPTWEYDPDFDIRNHVFRVQLEKPGTLEQLETLSGRIFTGMLDRNKPLWEVYVVEGLENEQTALIFKVHHCMVDGVAGIGLAFILFDMTPDTPKIRAPKYKPEPLPDRLELFFDALWDNAIEGIEHWANFQKQLAAYAAGLDASEVALGAGKFAATMTNFLLPVPKLPFNQPLNPNRRVVWIKLPFTDARAIRAVAGGTVNDVILATLGQATRRFLEDCSPRQRIPRHMRILVPVNVRQEHERASLGNRISFMPVDVPLHLEDPVERLNAVHLATSDLKESKIPESVSLMFEALQGMPAPLQALALGTVTNPLMQAILNRITGIPPANMICTNVPGPNIPLYVLGHRLLAIYPKVPVCLEMGINCAISSYDQQLFLTLCSDGYAGREVRRYAEFVKQSFAELRDAAEVKQSNYIRITRGTRGEAEMQTPPPSPSDNGHGKAASDHPQRVKMPVSAN